MRGQERIEGGREMSSEGAREDGRREGARKGGKLQGRYREDHSGQYTVYSAKNNPQRDP